MFIYKKLDVYKCKMANVWRKEHYYNPSAINLIKELNDYLHVRSHEDISILFLKHGFHKLHSNSIFVFQNPICSDTINLTCICFEIGILFIFTHNIFKICRINIRGSRWRHFDYFLIIFHLFNLQSLFLHHLMSLKWRIK